MRLFVVIALTIRYALSSVLIAVQAGNIAARTEILTGVVKTAACIKAENRPCALFEQIRRNIRTARERNILFEYFFQLFQRFWTSLNFCNRIFQKSGDLLHIKITITSKCHLRLLVQICHKSNIVFFKTETNQRRF